RPARRRARTPASHHRRAPRPAALRPARRDGPTGRMDRRLPGRQRLEQAAQVRRQALTVGEGQLVHVAQRRRLLFSEIRAEDDELAAVDAEPLAQLEILLDVLPELTALALDEH